MASITVEQRILEVVDKLALSNKKKTIVLYGKHGIGKTWTARKVLEKARNDLLFGFTLWVSMNTEFDETFYEKIASQLSLPSSDDDQEKKEDANNDELRAAEEKEQRLEKLKNKISAKLANKRYFVILDGKGNTMKEAADIMSKLEKNVLSQATEKESKVLITIDDGEISEGDKIFIEEVKPLSEQESLKDKISFEVMPLSEQESLKLLRERVITKNDSNNSRYDSHFEAIIKMSNGLPATIITMATFLRYIRKHDDGVWKFQSTLEEVAKLNDYEKMTQLLSSALYTSPRTKADIDMFDCSWQSRQFFSGVHCSVHYNELITYWILEGCLGDVDDVDVAYARGHSVLMKLVKSGMLTKQEDNYVSMDEHLLKVVDRRRYVYRGTASVGLTDVGKKDLKWVGLGIISKSLSNGEKPLKKLSTLLIDWHRLCREVPDSLFDQLLGLRILALFNPRLESMPSSLSKLRNLDVLVLRGCFLLKTIDNIEKLNALTVLEISCADESLKEIPEKLFEHMPKLRTFILSAKRIKSLPKSISNQIELCRLILSGCSNLVTLPAIAKLTKLEILDLSGAKSFKSFTDKSFESLAELQLLDLSHTQIDPLPFLKKLGKLSRLFLRGSPSYRLRALDALTGLEILDLSGSKSFKDVNNNVFLNKEVLRIIDLSGTKMEYFPSTTEIKKIELIDLSNNAHLKRLEDQTLDHLTSLRLLNISNTSVTKLPGISKLYSLRQLLLNGCSLLGELSEMEELTGLEVLDLSGAKALKKIEHLNHANLRRLLLHGCAKLQKLPQLGDSLKLEELDLSGCEALTDIQDTSFEHLTHLVKLNLSTTKIESLPSLSDLKNLLHLSLRECINLKELPPLESLSNLEELDLFGACKLGEIQGDRFLQHMESLRILNFSGIPRVTLPSMSKLPKLKQLVLQGCSELENISGLETLTELEILNLSETKISSLPPLNSFSKLRELLLRGSLIKELNDLNSLGQLEALDLFRTGIEEFPYEISNLTRLRHLDLPKMDGYQVDWGRIKWLPKELNLEECGLFKVPEPCIENNNCKLSITVTSTKLFEFFKSIPGLWETYFKQFEISVCSPEHCEDSDILSANDEEMFREIYALHTRKSTDSDKHCRSLEIRGFDDSFPTGLEDVLRYAESVSLSDNKFKNCLSILRADSMKRCWIERCNEMENIISGKEEDGGRLGGAGLEFLWVSNMAKLKSVYSSESMQPESFNNLKELYLDCCPKLVHVFSSSHQPTKLEILRIKFCDQLETIFEENAATAFEMPNLRTLHLVNLPKLKSIGVLLPPQFEMKPKPIECPHLKYPPELHCEVSNPDVC